MKDQALDSFNRSASILFLLDAGFATVDRDDMGHRAYVYKLNDFQWSVSEEEITVHELSPSDILLGLITASMDHHIEDDDFFSRLFGSETKIVHRSPEVPEVLNRKPQPLPLFPSIAGR